MDFLESIDSTIWAAIIVGVLGIVAAFIARGRKGKETSPQSIKPLNQIPSPDRAFIGRDKELKDLIKKVKKSGAHISGIKGMGGIGKTQLAFKLAEKLKPKYPDAQIYLDLKGVTGDNQIPLEPKEALGHIIRAFEPEIQLPETVQELGAIFRSLLEKKKAILLMDNAFDEDQLKPLIPPKGSILLVTSRKNFHLEGIPFLPLDTLSPKKSIELLLKLSKRIDDHAGEIAKLCGYLPLALNVAGNAMAVNPNFSPKEYIEDLKKNEALGSVDASITASCKWLDEAEQNYFYRLFVFPGSFDSRAAGAVWEVEEGEAKKRSATSSIFHWSNGMMKSNATTCTTSPAFLLASS